MSDVPSRPFRAELARRRPLSSNVLSLVLRVAEETPLVWHAGQYIEIAVGRGPRKPYSIASAMGACGQGELEIAVTLGSGAGHLDELPEGAWLSGVGPAGELKRARAGAPAVFVAAGTGVAPLRAMIQDELRRQADTQLLLLYGCRSEADILWREELNELAAQHHRFRFVPTLTRAEQSWTGRRGRVQDHLHEVAAPFARQGADFYVCGSSSMVSECVELLQAKLGVPREHLFTERC